MNQHNDHSVIYNLISKKLTGELSPEEKSVLDQLMSASEENQRIATDVEKIWNQSAPSVQVDTDLAWNALSDRITEHDEDNVIPITVAPSHSFRLISIAASLALIIGIFALYKWGQKPIMLTRLATITELITLPDGTKVDVQAGSTISYPEEFTGKIREITLSGTAFFDVIKNVEQPFIIHSGEVDVKVLGTSFYVQTTHEGNIDVNVKTGTVRVAQVADTSNQVTLQANENIRFEKKTGQLNPIDHVENHLFWKTKTLVFRRTPLTQVVDIVNSSYNKEISLGNIELSNCNLTATFKNNSFEEVIEVIKTTFSITIDRKDSKWILNGTGCE